jgi:hypothetical protein
MLPTVLEKPQVGDDTLLALEGLVVMAMFTGRAPGAMMALGTDLVTVRGGRMG